MKKSVFFCPNSTPPMLDDGRIGTVRVVESNRVNVLEVAIDRVVFERGASAAGDEELLDDLSRTRDSTCRVVSEVHAAVERDLLPSLQVASHLLKVAAQRQDLTVEHGGGFCSDDAVGERLLGLAARRLGHLVFMKSMYESSAPRAAPTAGVETERTWI